MIILIGLTLLATGCVSALGTATATANAAAEGLKAAHADLGLRYKADQVAAAKRVQGDRSDPTVKAEQRDRVRAVRTKYRPLWDAYAVVYEAWVDVVAAIEVAQQVDGAGGALDLVTITDLLRTLLSAQRRWVVLIQQLEGDRDADSH
jgi:hypothetical protein